MRSRVFVYNGFASTSPFVELQNIRKAEIDKIDAGEWGHLLFSSSTNKLFSLTRRARDYSPGAAAQNGNQQVAHYRISSVNGTQENISVTQVACAEHLVVVTDDGSLYMKGRRINKFLTKLPFTPPVTNVPNIFNSVYHRPKEPQLTLIPSVAKAACSNHKIYLVARSDRDNDGDLYSLDEYGRGVDKVDEDFSETLILDGAGEIKKIVAGYNHLVILTTNGYCYGTGESHHGELGQQGQFDRVISLDFFNRALPRIEIKDVHVGLYHSVFVPENEPDVVYTCGRNVDGELGMATEPSFKVVTVQKVKIPGLSKDSLLLRINSKDQASPVDFFPPELKEHVKLDYLIKMLKMGNLKLRDISGETHGMQLFLFEEDDVYLKFNLSQVVHSSVFSDIVCRFTN